tara:strand:- start:2268 stop:2411 length:144 start_codon:yes stop_codon:yes gene_type:complete
MHNEIYCFEIICEGFNGASFLPHPLNENTKKNKIIKIIDLNFIFLIL